MNRPREMLVQYAHAADGTRIAFSSSGRGPAVLRAPTWLNHLEHDARGPTLRHWLDELSAYASFVRYDARGCGLSQRNAPGFALEDMVSDLEAVADAAGLDRFTLMGTSMGAAVSIAYAARHPDRVARMVLGGAFCRGRLVRDPSPAMQEKARMLLKLIEHGWGSDDPAFLQVFTAQFMPGASQEQWRWFNEHLRLATTADVAVQISRTVQTLDVQAQAREVRCPVLLMHSRRDAVVPYEEGQHTASLIPGARLLTLDSANHTILAQEPAWQVIRRTLREFLTCPATDGSLPALTPRQRQVLDLIRAGRRNEEIAAALGVSEKTVRNMATHIYAALGVASRTQAAVRATLAGLGDEKKQADPM